MTKAPESGDSDITDAVRREAQRTGRSLCDILREWRRAAAKRKDKLRVQDILKAEKFLDCRNRRKRRSK